MTLLAAATALDALAAGLEPRRGDVISGALVLQTLVHRGEGDRDLQDAALGLEAVATGRSLDLDQAGRDRAAELAKKVREFLSTLNT
jgi:hypothetical protein